MDVNRHVKKTIVVVIGAIIYAVAMNFFLVPGGVFASGLAGVAQLVSGVSEELLNIHLSTGFLLFALNIPIVYIAWKELGFNFTFYSALSVGVMTFALEVLPVVNVSDDILINAIFGGIIGAIGVGITLKFGASTGGLDIIALVTSIKKGNSVGTYIFLINAFIIVAAGFLYNWEQALYTIISLYASIRIIDAIHTSHVKLTVFIVTTKSDEIKDALFSKMVRGVTIMPAVGGYTKEEKRVLMVVLTRYELYELTQTIRDIDPQAFTNVVETVDVVGNFRKEFKV